MALTLFLLGLVYAVLVGVLIAAGTGVVAIAVIAGLLFVFQLFTSDKIALSSMGATFAASALSAGSPWMYAVMTDIVKTPMTKSSGPESLNSEPITASEREPARAAFHAGSLSGL